MQVQLRENVETIYLCVSLLVGTTTFLLDDTARCFQEFKTEELAFLNDKVPKLSQWHERLIDFFALPWTKTSFR